MSKNNADLLRARLRKLRQTMSVAERQHDSAALCELLRAGFESLLARWAPKQAAPLSVAGFWPLEFEPDLRPLLHWLDQHQVVVCLPVIVQPHSPLEFHRWTAHTTLSTQQFGVCEPPRTVPLTPDVVLVPTLGFTTEHARLGYGGGYYDRSLAALNQSDHPPLTIGVAWAQAQLKQAADQCPDPCPDKRAERFSPQAHDVILHAIATPLGWSGASPFPAVD